MNETVKLGDIVKPRREKVSPANFADAPFIGMENIEAHSMRLLGTVPAGTMRSSANRFYKGDVLYGRLRPYLNKVYRPNFDGLCSSEFIVMPKTEGVAPDYLKYRLNAHDFVSFANHLNAGDRPRVDFDQLSLFELILPSYVEQQQVVSEIEKQFSRLDEAVAWLKRIEVNLKRYKTAVLRIAVEGRLTEEWRSRRSERPFAPTKDESGAELLKRILAERKKKWEEKNPGKKYKEPTAPDTSNLPMLPKGWVWASVEQMAEVGTGATPLRSKRAYYDDGKIPWVTSGALNEEFVSSADEYITDLAVKETNAKVFPTHTLLVAMYGEGKTRGKVSELLIDAATNQACAAIVMKGLSAEVRDYVKLFFLKNYDDIRRLSSGGVQPNLNLGHIKATELPLPPLVEQRHIVAEVDRLLSVAEEIELSVDNSLKRAERLRQGILKKAFWGELIPRQAAYGSREPEDLLMAAESTTPYGKP